MGGGPRAVPEQLRTVLPPAAGTTRLVLVRHGEAACNVAGVVGGVRGCGGLTATGAQQAGALARRLEASGELAGAVAVYASVLPRAVETARALLPAVGGGDRGLVTDCGLCELHPGEADGLDWAEFTRRYGEPRWDDDPALPIAPGGESWSGFVDRAADALEQVAARHAGAQVVVVCHGGVIEAAMLRFLPVAAVRGRLRLHTRHTSMTEWELGPYGWRLLRYNDAAHLPPGQD